MARQFLCCDALRVACCTRAISSGGGRSDGAQLRAPRWGTNFLVLAAVVACALCLRVAAHAQEEPYFVTYSDVLEEPGNLEIELKGLTASPKDAGGFFSPTLELEYGATAWWTTEAYLEGQTTANDSAVFTGFRWENRFRVLETGHGIDPVLYVEYEDVNGADKSLLEVVGNDGAGDLRGPNADASQEIEREIEGKLIFSSYAEGWNFSENFIAGKNLANGPWEFGYALGASRPLALKGRARECMFCRQNFAAGAELYGGLGTARSFGLANTSHYSGPAVNWALPHGTTVGFSPQFGLNGNSVGVLWRFNLSYEIQQFRNLFTRGGEAQ